MTGLWLRVDPATLARALETPQDCDEVLKAAALRKSMLLGETSEPIDSNEQNLAAALASPANPYGSAKHGVFDAASAAEAGRCSAHDPDGWGYRCSLPAGHTGEHSAQDGDGNVLATWPPPDPASAAEVAEGVEPACDCLVENWGSRLGGAILGCPKHDPERTGDRRAALLCGIDHDAAARLAPPAGYQLPSASIPGEGA